MNQEAKKACNLLELVTEGEKIDPFLTSGMDVKNNGKWERKANVVPCCET